MAHREVLAVEFEFLPHVKQVQVGMVQQQMNEHVPLPAHLQEVTQQLHITKVVRDNDQGLRNMQDKTDISSDVCATALCTQKVLKCKMKCKHSMQKRTYTHCTSAALRMNSLIRSFMLAALQRDWK